MYKNSGLPAVLFSLLAVINFLHNQHSPNNRNSR